MTCAILLLGTADIVRAQETLPGSASPGRVRNQIQNLELDQKVVPQVDVPEIRVEGAPAGADNIRFVLKTVTLEGVNAYSQDELAPIYANDIGQTITLTRLYEIAGEITRKYRNDGYIITQTVVPVQTIEGGDAKLLVVEGALDQIIVEGDVNERDGLRIRQIADKLKNSQPLSSKDMERYLLLINDLPGVSARSIIGPSATANGRADMRVIVTRDPYSFLAGIDNYGSAFLGPWEIAGAAQFNNILGLNDSIVAQMVTAPYDDELYYTYLAYGLPLNAEGTKLTLDLTYSDTEPGFTARALGAEGFSTMWGATLEHPFIRSRNENLTARLRFDMESSSTKSDIIGASTDDDIRSARIGARYEKLSTLIGTSVNMIDVQLSQGLDVFHASDEGDSDLSRLDGDPQYTKFEAEITRLQRIVKDFNVLVGVKGQVANSPLLSPEEFGVGGMSYGYGRGYDPSEITGDNGVAAKVEVQWNTHMFDGTIESLQVFGFYDVGTVWNKDATTPADERNSVASTGLGLRSRITPSITADATVAFPMTADVATEGDTDPRYFVSLVSRF